MNQNNRYVPLVDARPAAEVLNTSVSFPAMDLVSMKADLDSIVVDALSGGIARCFRGMLANDPKRASELAFIERIERDRNFSTEFRLKVAVMHPQKLRELEAAALENSRLRKLVDKREEEVEQLKQTNALLASKAKKYDQLMSDIASAAAVSQADF